MTVDNETQQLQALLETWAGSLDVFSRSFDIRNKDLDTIPFVPTAPQRAVFETIEANKRSFFLKGRQMFITTATVITALRECLFRPGTRVCVAAHDDKSAIEVGNFYVEMHANNPLLRELMPITRNRDHKIVFGNKSKILIGTANSEFWRGFPTHFAHLTEAAMYDDMGATLSSLGNTVPKNGIIVVESTAYGENDFYHMWKDRRSSYARRFLCWKDHHEYRSDDPIPGDLTDDERAYIRTHGLTKQQASWYVDKRRGLPPDKLPMFDQEFPATADMAFLLSGNKFLTRTVRVPAPAQVDASGISRIEPFDAKSQYAIGIDVASGSTDGDFSTVVVGNLTKKSVACTVAVRMAEAEFKYLARKIAAEYGDPTSCIEITTIGVDTSDHFRQEGVPQYITERVKGMATTLVQQYGWETNPQTRPILFGRIFEASIGASPWIIGCRRLVEQLNSLCYNRDHKPQAPKGEHDDLAVAFGLMVMAVPQARPPKVVEVDAQSLLPRTIFEEVAYIQKYGWEQLQKLKQAEQLRHDVPADMDYVPMY